MTSPSTIIYVRPAWASTTWTYAGTTLPSGASSSTVSAVAFDIASAGGQDLSRGQLQYSVDNGKTWLGYTLPVDGQGAYVQATGTVWRFLDRSGSDYTTMNTFSAHYKLADGSVVSSDNTVIVDNPPSSLTGENDTMFSTLQAGAVVDMLSPVDSGALTGGRWVIDSQSQPGLFSISYNPAVDTSARLVIADASQLPMTGMGAAVTIHYYDRYTLDTNGNPIAGQGVTRTLVYTVEDGVTHDLAGFGDDIKVGAATSAYNANPSMAALSNGGLVAVWQGSDTGGSGAGLWAQLRDASGAATGAAFALTPNGDATIEGEPAVTALANGRFVVAYSMLDAGVSRVAYRVVEANGSAGAEHVLDTGAGGAAAMPAIATLADGSFAVGWRSGGTVHVQQAAAADGAPAGAQQVYTALASAWSPSLAALKSGGYVVSWGEINDGNVYAATSSARVPFVVNGDGAAASLNTAAPLPHVTTLANGNFVVAWDSYANEPLGFSICDVFFQVYDSSGHALGSPVQANIESGGGRYDAAVTALSDGSFVIAWQSQTGDFDGSGIFGRRFGADGSAVDLVEFEINQMRAGDQTSPDVVALANGGFAAAWVDAGSSGVAVEARVFMGTAAPAGVPTATASVPSAVTSPLQSGSQVSNAGSAVSEPAAVVTAPAVTAPVVTAAVVTAPVVAAPAAPVATAPGTPVLATPGAPAASSLLASAGNNVLAAGTAGGLLDGKAGMDTVVFSGQRAAYALASDATGVSVVDAASGIKTLLANVERLQFSDQGVALDVNGNAGEAYRLYQAALNRTPDKAGLSFWINAMDEGHGLQEVAANFVGSAEFVQKYGADTSDAQYVSALYQNVLHRAPDAAGYDFWLQALHNTSRAKVLTDFSESAENQTQVMSAIRNGIDYTPAQLGTAGNNVMAASSGALLDGKEGVDMVVFGGQRAGYTVTKDGAGVSVVDAASGIKTLLANVERLQFSDQSVALDVNGNAGEAYRLYQAALNRTPDKAGLSFWINAMDEGHGLQEVAASFVGSAEFVQKYGANTSDAQYVSALYQNVLHRAPDAAGYDFWLQALHDTSRAQVLTDFSESQENQVQIIGAIQNGIDYTPAV
jgi:hypothetical protein